MPDRQTSLSGALSELPRFPLFAGLTQNILAELCREGQVKVSQHRDLLFEAGNSGTHFGVVLSGAYKLARISPSGEDSVIHFCSPGDVLAALVMPQPKPVYPVSAIAMGPSRALMIRREVYLEKWVPMPELVIRIQGLLSSRMARFQNQKVMQRAPLPSKVAALLLNLVSRDSRVDELEVPVPLTRKEIADTLGVTVESVIRVMSDWSKQGYVTTNEKQIKILRPDILVEQVNLAAD